LSGKIKHFIGITLLSVLLLFGAFLSFGTVLNLNTYKQSCQDPIIAQVTVTRHGTTTDSDNTITYNAYICYRVNDTDYTDILYKSSSNPDDLPAVDSVFPLALNPNDLSEPLSALANPPMACFFFGITAFSVSMLLRICHRWQLTRNELGVIDLEAAIRDMRALILGRFLRPFSFLSCVSLLFLSNCYPMVFGQGYQIAGAVLGCVWLVCLRNAIRQNSCIANEEFRPVKGLHIYKDVHVDPKTGISSNVIHYRLGQTKWTKIVPSSVYQHVRTGFSISRVTLNCSPNKPFLHYDNTGTARGS